MNSRAKIVAVCSVPALILAISVYPQSLKNSIGMEFVLVDKNSHEQNFKHQMMNLFKETRDANPHEPGQLPMTAAVHLRREPDDNVIKFVWLTVRQGLMRTLGVIN